MAITFTFTLNDADAENLLDCIHAERLRMFNLAGIELAGENRPEFMQWFKSHAAYLIRIKDRVLSNQVPVPDSPEHDCECPQPPSNKIAQTQEGQTP